ncbi:hypothetical protein PHJA_001426800 [Phtheirospermum japonicum]|uniref:Uncharacterized protein n=1 Tax=Phtheirospermum japonicum TaxID=374723 RepID=A0A830CC88_9LAMI|nr:hypothetical protein PHJA_001426800 [Phtheirospermum japonicum]
MSPFAVLIPTFMKVMMGNFKKQMISQGQSTTIKQISHVRYWVADRALLPSFLPFCQNQALVLLASDASLLILGPKVGDSLVWRSSEKDNGDAMVVVMW